MYQLVPFLELMNRSGLSERQLGKATGLSRGAIRAAIGTAPGNPTLSTLTTLANYFNIDLSLVANPRQPNVPGGAPISAIEASLLVQRDGFSSWKIHFMDLVDYFRRTLDTSCLLMPPAQKIDKKLYALLSSIVQQLSLDAGISPPPWSMRPQFLEKPWFVSETESLKAFALLESPLSFRANNIFVLGNFLERA
jgi:transcriptional regulator with XRE-family HTH domain